MALTLFYDALTRSGAIADITADQVLTKKVLTPGSLDHWTHFVHLPNLLLSDTVKIFVYNRYTRAGAIGFLTENDLVLEKRLGPGSLIPWTHITAVGSLLFFYDQNSGTGAFAETAPKTIHVDNVKKSMAAVDLSGLKLEHQTEPEMSIIKGIKIGPQTEADCVTVRSFDPGSFSTWTHVVSVGLHLFFYNQNSGAGSLQRVRRKPPVTARDFVLGGEVEMHTVKDFTKGSLGFWTHVTAAAPYLLFYNLHNRSGKIVRISDEGLEKVRDFGPNSFGSWTHIVSGETLGIAKTSAKPGGMEKQIGVLGQMSGVIEPLHTFLATDGASILFYDRQSGIGAMSKINAGAYTNGKVYDKPGAFGKWSSISDSAAYDSPYDYGYHLGKNEKGEPELRSITQPLTLGASVPTSENLSEEQQEEIISLTTEKIEEFFEKHGDEIKSGKIKAVDLGGMLYATASGVILTAFNPLAGLAFLAKIMGYSAFSVAEQAGRFYGAAVDDLVKTLKDLKDTSPGDLIKVVAVMKTMALVSSQLHIIPLFGESGWELTKKVGVMLGGAVEDGVKTVSDAVGDVWDFGEMAIENLGNFFKHFLDI